MGQEMPCNRGCPGPITALQVPYSIAANEDAGIVLRCPTISEGYVTPEDVSAHVLSHLLGLVKQQLGTDIERAVISVSQGLMLPAACLLSWCHAGQ